MRKVKWLGWRLINVGDFVKSSWWSCVFVIRLGRVNPESCRRWPFEVAMIYFELFRTSVSLYGDVTDSAALLC